MSCILLSSFWKKEKESKRAFSRSSSWEWKDKSFRAMVNGKRDNPPCLGAYVFPHSGGKGDMQQEQICFCNEKVTQLLSLLHQRGVSSGRSAVKNKFHKSHLAWNRGPDYQKKKTFPSHIAHLALHPMQILLDWSLALFQYTLCLDVYSYHINWPSSHLRPWKARGANHIRNQGKGDTSVILSSPHCLPEEN